VPCGGATLEALSTAGAGDRSLGPAVRRASAAGGFGRVALSGNANERAVRTPFGPSAGIRRTSLKRFVVLAFVALPLLAGCRARDGEGIERDPPPSAQLAAGKVRVREAPPAGDVDALVRSALATAMSDKRRVVVYVGAEWCEPCQRFHQAAERGELDGTFPDVDLLVFDHDRDGKRLASAGYVSKLIPLFALPGPDGRASGKQVEGGIKGEGAVANIAPRLQRMLSE
jgi:hypothetical protein